MKRFYFQYQTEAMPKGISIEHSVPVIKYLITYSTNGTKKVQIESNQACLDC